jgi:hypothetical protein
VDPAEIDGRKRLLDGIVKWLQGFGDASADRAWALANEASRVLMALSSSVQRLDASANALL